MDTFHAVFQILYSSIYSNKSSSCSSIINFYESNRCSKWYLGFKSVGNLWYIERNLSPNKFKSQKDKDVSPSLSHFNGLPNNCDCSFCLPCWWINGFFKLHLMVSKRSVLTSRLKHKSFCSTPAKWIKSIWNNTEYHVLYDILYFP